MSVSRILAIGYACFDMTFSVDRHLGADEKGTADRLTACGGGLAANAAAAAGALGYDVTLAAYLGHDALGDTHVAELRTRGVKTDRLLRGDAPTGVSAILVKPDGQRSLVAYRGDQPQYAADAIDLDEFQPDVLLVDGYQTALAHSLLCKSEEKGIPSVLDADGPSRDTGDMARVVDHLVASERFAFGFTGCATMSDALAALARIAPNVVVTRGAQGLVWARNGASGTLPAYRVDARDTNGAGDAFHGAYAGGLGEGMEWERLLRFASATAALCCLTVGSRLGLPGRAEVEHLMHSQAL